MDIYHKLLCGLVLALLAGGAIGAYDYAATREEKARIEERQKADSAVIAVKDAALKTQADQLQTQTAAFEKFKQDQATAMQAMEQRFTQAQTAQQNATLTAALLGLKPTDVKVGGTAAAPTIDTPVANLKAYENACETCKLQLASASQQIALAKTHQAYSDSQVSDLQTKVDNLTKENGDQKKLAAGGSLGKRVVHDTKAGFYGAAIEALLLALTGHLK
jgi:hypothetical protein